MALPFLEQQVHDVYFAFQGFGERNAIERNGAGRRGPDVQCRSLPDRDDVRYRGLAVKYGDGLTAANSPKVLAEMSLELRDTNLLHDLIMTTSGLNSKRLGFDAPGRELGGAKGSRGPGRAAETVRSAVEVGWSTC
jgi:hypothetical protein